MNTLSFNVAYLLNINKAAQVGTIAFIILSPLCSLVIRFFIVLLFFKQDENSSYFSLIALCEIVCKSINICDSVY